MGCGTGVAPGGGLGEGDEHFRVGFDDLGAEESVTDRWPLTQAVGDPDVDSAPSGLAGRVVVEPRANLAESLGSTVRGRHFA